MATNDKNKSEHVSKQVKEDENRDPISGAKGSHPVGSGLGAAGGATAGAAVGMFGGPVGIAAGAVVGGLVGGLAGKGIAEKIDPTVEHSYWRNEYPNRDYADPARPYDYYAPAYQYGWESSAREFGENEKHPRSFEEIEADLKRDWDKHRSDEDPEWDDARHPTKDAYSRTYESLQGKRGLM